jgi:acetoin utilization deacetylase AcuC-like enzyme
MRCFYHEDYFLPLPIGHPFPMEKFPQAHALLKDCVHVVSPLPLTRSDLERVHRADYLNAVNFDFDDGVETGLSRYDRNRLGLPAHPRLLARSSWETAGTVSATWAALEDGIAANLAGGTHHAFPDRGLGFCVLNDIAVAIEAIRNGGRHLDSILIVDTDAHQGNANHAYFEHDLGVFTYSIHVGKNYPAKKEVGDCDVPLDRYVSGRDYLWALEKTLPEVFARTEPDLVFWISGADCHADDRFGQMLLSRTDMESRDRLVVELCRHFAAPTVVVYGGGYNRAAGVTAALHAQSIRIAAGVA